MQPRTVYPPQTNSAVEATMAKAKLLGLIIDRQEVGSTRDYEFETRCDKSQPIVKRVKKGLKINDMTFRRLHRHFGTKLQAVQREVSRGRRRSPAED